MSVGASGATSGSASADPTPIATHLQVDRLAIAAGIGLVAVVNGFFIEEPRVWFVVPVLIVGIALESLALDRLSRGQVLACVGLVTVAKWLIAGAVSVMFPFVWPVMLLTAVSPLVIATPYLPQRLLLVALSGGAAMAAAVGAIGLVLDNRGVVMDIDNTLELVVVMVAIAAQTVTVGFVVWQNNRLQRDALTRANQLNADLIRSERDLAASRRRVVEAADEARSRIERDLHDGAQQRLVAVGMRLRLLETEIDPDGGAPSSLSELVGEVDEAVEELRELAHGIYPPLLATRGLGEALTSMARRSSQRVDVDIATAHRCNPAVEAALYFTALEALSNAAKHAPGATVEVALQGAGGDIELVVADDGPGFDPAGNDGGRGMLNMTDRLAAVGGQLRVESALDRGTKVVALVPAVEADDI